MGIIGGILSILGSSSFVAILILMLALSRIDFAQKNKATYIIAISILISALYNTVFLIFLNEDLFLSFINDKSKIDLFLDIAFGLNLIIGLWISGAFHLLSPNIYASKITIAFIISIICIIFTISALTSNMPIIGTLMIESYNNEDIYFKMISFAIGQLFTVALITYFSTLLYSKYGDKKWLKITQRVSGVLIILSSIVGYLYSPFS